MSDIAQLGLAVDSSQVVAATAALNQFTKAAQPAASATAQLQQAAGVVTESLRGQRLVLAGLTADLGLLGGGLGQAAAIASTLYLENAHLADGWSGLKTAIGGLITPTNLLIGGFAALAVGGYEVITSIVAQEKAFDDLAMRTNETLQSVHALASAASFKGIDATDFLKQMTDLGTLTAQAQNNMGGLAELFRVNGKTIGDNNANLLTLADLIKNASSEQEKYLLIQQAGLPATRQWVDLLSQGSAGIQTAANRAVQFGNEADQQLIAKARAFDQAWAEAWNSFTNYAKAGIVNATSYFDQLANSPSFLAVAKAVAGAVIPGSSLLYDATLGRPPTNAQTVTQGFNSLNSANYNNPALQRGLNSVANPGGNTTTTDPNALKKQIADNQQLIGLLGPLATVDQLVAQKENDINLARAAGVPITKSQEAAMLAFAQASALGITQIHSQTDALKVESQTFGMTAGQAAEFSAVQTKINEAQRTGNPLTAQQIAYLHQEASALGDAAQRLDEMRTAQSALSSAFQTFRTDMENGTSAWTALKDAAISALNSISDKLMDMAAKNLVAAAFGGGSSGGGSGSIMGLIGGLFGGGGGSVAEGGKLGLEAIGLHDGGMVGTDVTFNRYVHPAYFDNAPRFHDGGIAGDEVPIIAKAGEGVFTPAQMAALAPAGGAASSAPMNVTVTQHNDFRGTDPSSIARINAALVQTKNAAVQEALTGMLKLQKSMPAVTRPQ